MGTIRVLAKKNYHFHNYKAQSRIPNTPNPSATVSVTGGVITDIPDWVASTSFFKLLLTNGNISELVVPVQVSVSGISDGSSGISTEQRDASLIGSPSSPEQDLATLGVNAVVPKSRKRTS